MFKLVNFAKAVDHNPPPDVMAECKEKGRLRKHIQDLSEMSNRERSFYEESVKDSLKRFLNFEYWTKIIQQFIMYRKPNIIGCEDIESLNPDDLYVGACFMGHGKQNYVVQHGKEFYLHNVINDYRREPILYQPSDTHCRQDKRKLRIPAVFANWQFDTRDLLNKHADSDVECWKLRHFIEDKAEVG